MKSLFFTIAALLVGLPVQSETVYLVILTNLFAKAPSVHSVPMESIQQCEEAGVTLIASKRYKPKHDKGGLDVGFECIVGK